MQSPKAPTTIYRLDRADGLPGHNDGRQALINKLSGQAHLTTIVAGHWQNDTFNVTDYLVVDSDDPTDGYWYGGEDGEVIGWSADKDEAADDAVRTLERRYPDAETRAASKN